MPDGEQPDTPRDQPTPRRRPRPGAGGRPTRNPAGRGRPPRDTNHRPTRTPHPTAPANGDREPLPHFSEALSREVLDELRQTTGSPERFQTAARALTRAIVALAADDDTTAVAAAEDAKRIAPRSAAVREALGLSRYRTGAHREARSELSAAQRLSGSADFTAMLADIERALGRPEKAIELFTGSDTSKMAPDTAAELLLVAAAAYGDLGRPAAGAALIRRHGTWPAHLRDHHLRLAYTQGTLFEQAGDHASARRAFERVATADPDFFDVTDRLRALRND